MEQIYEKIRTLRIKKNLTLKDLSEKTGLSISFLSQVERSESSLAITSLQKIAEALGVPITQFFEEVTNKHYVVKVTDRKPFQIEGSHVIFSRLSGDLPGRMLEPLIITLNPGQDQEGTLSHPGEEFYFVISGTVTMVIEDKEYILSNGDSLHFPSHLSHAWFNSTEEAVQILCVLTPVIFQ